ncbi:MAG TPA: GNAT family N-acetyltransferase [Roseiflexaceae bacterium]|nr:GNAT family N-acetyltransferase [Roseiflexaceae bacterium]
MPIIIRPALAEDQHAITAIVRAALINPLDLDWQRFLVAQWGQDIIAVGQVKPHQDGSRELASIAVVPEWQGQGVGSALIRGLLARETGTLHLMCAANAERYYERFGFRRIDRREMPRFFRRFDRLASVLSVLSFNRLRTVVMRRTE